MSAPGICSGRTCKHAVPSTTQTCSARVSRLVTRHQVPTSGAGGVRRGEVVGGEKMGGGCGVFVSRLSLSLGSWVAAAVSRSLHRYFLYPSSFRRHRRCQCALRWPCAVAHTHSTPPAPLPPVAPHRAHVHIVVCPCWWSRPLAEPQPFEWKASCVLAGRRSGGRTGRRRTVRAS